MKRHNFSAGPCILPQEVMRKAAEAVAEAKGKSTSAKNYPIHGSTHTAHNHT